MKCNVKTLTDNNASLEEELTRLRKVAQAKQHQPDLFPNSAPPDAGKQKLESVSIINLRHALVELLKDSPYFALHSFAY